MAIALVGQAGLAGSSVGSPQTITYSSTAGNTLIIAGHIFSGSAQPVTANITDTAGNAWQFSTSASQNPPLAQNSKSGAFLLNFAAWAIAAAHVTSVTITVTNAAFWRLAVTEFSGVAAFAGSAATTAASGTTLTSTAVTVPVPGALAIGAGSCNSGTEGVPSGWTQLTSYGSVGEAGFLVGPAAGSYAPAWTTTVSDIWAAAFAVFTPLTAPVAPAMPGRTWQRRFKHRQQTLPVPFATQTITGTANLAGAAKVTAGTISFPAVPGKAVPGLFTPGNPGGSALVIPAPSVAAVVVQAASPGRTWQRRFKHRQAPLQPPGLPGPVTITATATITAAGSVTALAVQDAGISTTLAGAGSVTAVVTEAAGASPAGAGAVTDVATEAVTATAAGAGAVTGTVTGIAGGSCAGAGAVAAVVTQACIASPAGAGAVSANASVISGANTAALTGAGSVTAVVTEIITATSAGAGSVTAAAAQGTGANLAGAGAIGTPDVTQAVTASLAGAGAVTTAVTQIATATIAGAGSLSATSGGFVSGTATLAGAGALTAAASVSAIATAALVGAGSLTAVVTERVPATLAGAGALAASPSGLVPGTAALIGAGALSAAASQHGAIVAAASSATVTARDTSMSSGADPPGRHRIRHRSGHVKAQRQLGGT